MPTPIAAASSNSPAAHETRGTVPSRRLPQRRRGSLPQTPDSIEPWAATVAHQKADVDPSVIETREQADKARHEQQRLAIRQLRERADLRRQLPGNRAPGSAESQAARWRQRAESARRDLALIESLPVVEAAQLVRERAQPEQAHARGRREGRAPAQRRSDPRLHPSTAQPWTDTARAGAGNVASLPAAARAGRSFAPGLGGDEAPR